MYAKHQLKKKEEARCAAGNLPTEVCARHLSKAQRHSTEQTTHQVQGQENDLPSTSIDANSQAFPSTGVEEHIQPFPSTIMEEGLHPVPPTFPLPPREQISTGSQPGAFCIRPGTGRTDCDSSSLGVPEREERSSSFLWMGHDDDTSTSSSATVTSTGRSDAPSSLGITISAILVEQGDEENGCPQQPQEEQQSSMTWVQAEPALEGYKAIVANKKCKFLAMAVVIVFVVVVVPLVVVWCNDVLSNDFANDEEYSSNCGTPLFQYADYRGQLNVTESGLACQRWDAQDPHPHKHTPEAYPSAGLQKNYCRNPTGGPDERAWCYTTDPSVLWEYCNVAACND